MIKYVSKDIICAKMMHCNFRSSDMTVSDFINDELPAADVQPVKHGHWEKLAIVPATDTGNSILARCSECGDTMIHTTIGREITLKYCANCGARMDLKDGDAE